MRQNIDGAELVPSVATSWEMSPDGTSYTFHLRKGIKWSDGEPFTADDMSTTTRTIWATRSW